MLRHYSYAALGQIGQAGLSLVGLVATTRLLGPDSYGTFVVLGTILILLLVAVSAGPQAAVLVLSARHADARAELHGQTLIAAGVLTVVTAIVAPLIAPATSQLISPSLAPGLVVASLIRLPALAYATLVSTQLSGAGRIGLAAILNTASAAFGLLGPLGAYLAPDPLAGAVVGTTVATAITALVTAFAGLSTFGVAASRGFGPWRAVGSIALPMHLGTLAYWLMLRADAIAVNSLLGARSAGIYGLALGLSERVGLLTSPLYNATAWRISGPDRRAGIQATLRVARLEFGIGVVAALAAVVLGPLGVTIIGGREYADAALPLAILVLGAAALPVWAAIGLFLISQMNGAWATTMAQIAVAGVAILGYLTLTPAIGILAPALVSTGAYAALVLVGVWLIRRREPFPLRLLVPSLADFASVSAAVGRVLGLRRSPKEAASGSAGGPPEEKELAGRGPSEAQQHAVEGVDGAPGDVGERGASARGMRHEPPR